MTRVALFPMLAENIVAMVADADHIAEERRACLRQLAGFVSQRITAGDPVGLIFICTHNSRRSQMAQIWAQTAAAHFGIRGVETYSGGTEATAFNPRAVAAIRRAGFQAEAVTDDANPIYLVRFSNDSDPIEAFSKVYDQPPNPADGFAAVMTCSEADAACPLVSGARERFAIAYEDPKAFDGTDREYDAYDERCRQIGREMLFVFSHVGP